jgi:Rhodopirellula transposase DDE domain
VPVDHRSKKTPLILSVLEELIAPETAGDPMTAQKWVRSSLRALSTKLEAAGHGVSLPTLARLLRKLDYSLHVNAKKIEASSNHPDRGPQFDYIAVQRAAFTAAGLPIVSHAGDQQNDHQWIG